MPKLFVMRVLVALVFLGTGCMPPARAPGMGEALPRAHDATSVELARVESRPDRRPLLVVYPRTACAGSASTVLLDEQGAFVGAIPPGGASLLSIPIETKTLTAMSSVEVTAARSSWTYAQSVEVPPLPSGLVLWPARWSTRDCGNGQYAEAKPATKEELETLLAEEDVVWLEPRLAEGQSWIEAHRDRVDEVLGTHRTGLPDVVARLKGRRAP